MGVFTLPSLGSDMEKGTLVEWLVGPGDTVHRGDVVAVLETQKGAIEIECFQEGTVQELLAETGKELPVGAPLATIVAPGETAPEVEIQQPPVGQPAPSAAPDIETAPETALLFTSGDVPASPAARRRARELNINLAAIKGSFSGGQIVLADVEAAAAEKPQLDQGEPQTAMANMRQAIGAAMTQSKRTIPHFYVSHTIDIQPSVDWLAAHNAGVPPAERILMGALFVCAAVRAAERVRVMNGRYEDGAFSPSERVNAGIAVALRGGGLVAPALIDADKMSLAETMGGLRDLVSRARAGRLRNSEMTEGTITISSLGETGAEEMTGVIFAPQVALVCLGAPQTRPWVVGDKVIPRTVVTVSVSADHRVSDGRQAAQFLQEFNAAISDPETL